MRYVSFIHRNDAGYGVSFPDFPGCVSVGDTIDEAVHHGSEALAFHVEGLMDDGESIPPPRSIDAINADPKLADWRREADLVLIAGPSRCHRSGCACPHRRAARRPCCIAS